MNSHNYKENEINKNIKIESMKYGEIKKIYEDIHREYEDIDNILKRLKFEVQNYSKFNPEDEQNYLDYEKVLTAVGFKSHPTNINGKEVYKNPRLIELEKAKEILYDLGCDKSDVLLEKIEILKSNWPFGLDGEKYFIEHFNQTLKSLYYKTKYYVDILSSKDIKNKIGLNFKRYFEIREDNLSGKSAVACPAHKYKPTEEIIKANYYMFKDHYDRLMKLIYLTIEKKDGRYVEKFYSKYNSLEDEFKAKNLELLGNIHYNFAVFNSFEQEAIKIYEKVKDYIEDYEDIY